MNRIEVADVLAAFRSPAQFQRELAALIDSRAADGRRKIIEVGCETAVTTLLLADANEKTVININRRAISLVEAAAAQLHKTVSALVCDMFAMPFRDAEFDVVFNAGVIEHFSAEERVRALSEYKIYDLGEEVRRCGLRVSERLTLFSGTVFNWLNFLPPAKALLRLLDKFFHYEGYLTGVILSKSHA